MRSRDGRHLSTRSRAASPGTWPKTNYQFPRCSSERLTTVPHHFNFAYRCTLHHFGTDRYEFHMVPPRNTIYRSHNGAYATTVLTIDSHSSLSSRALAGRQLALLRTACKTNMLPKMAMRDWNTRSQHHASFCNVMVITNETYRYRCILRTHQNVVWQSFKLAQRRQHECRRWAMSADSSSSAIVHIQHSRKVAKPTERAKIEGTRVGSGGRASLIERMIYTLFTFSIIQKCSETCGK